MAHAKVAKKVLKILSTKDHMFTYRRFDQLKVISYSDSDYVECVDKKIVESEDVRFIENGNIIENVRMHDVSI